MHRALLVASLLATTSACYTVDFVSEEEQLRFRTEGVTAGPNSNIVPSTSPVLVGTKLCATVCRNDGTDCTDDDALFAASCFTSSLTGPARLEGSCVTFDQPGGVRWDFAPVACEGGDALVSDGVGFDVVARDDVTARLVYPNEEWVAEALALPREDGEELTTTADGVPADVFPADGAPVLWMVGGTASVAATLERDGHRVIWEDAQARIDVRSDAEPDPDTTALGSDEALVMPEIEGSGDIAFVFDRTEWPLGRWEAVPQDAAKSLEIVVVNYVSEDSSGAIGARAVVRDDDGRPIFGVPVEWGSSEGNLAITVPQPGEGDPSYVMLMDNESCLPPSHREGDHSTTLQAKFGDLYDEITVEWTLPPLEETDAELAEADAAWEPDAVCLPKLSKPIAGCGCATSEPAGALAGVVALISAAFRARRRPGS